MALCIDGSLYSWGCNDDGALGRDEIKTPSNVPGKVNLPFPVDMACAGDSHSLACNSISGIVLFWGSYRDTNNTMAGGEKTPKRIGEGIFKNGTKIKKVKILNLKKFRKNRKNEKLINNIRFYLVVITP